MKRLFSLPIPVATACALIACRSGSPAAPQTSSDELLAQLQRQLDQRAGAQTLGPRISREQMLVGEGDRRVHRVSRSESPCVLATAASSSSLGDIDLYLLSEQGEVVAVDEESDASPTVSYCATGADDRVAYVVVQVARGHGMAALDTYAMPAPNHPPAGGSDEENDSKDDVSMLEVEVQRVIGRHATHVVSKGGFPLSAQTETRVDLALTPKRCDVVVARTSDGLRGAQAELVDAAGTILTRWQVGGAGAPRTIVLCSTVKTSVYWRWRARWGQGSGTWIVHEAPEEAFAELWPRAVLVGPTPEPLPNEVAPENSQNREPAQTVELAPGRWSDLSPEVPRGCFTVETDATFPLRSYVVEVTSPDGQLTSRRLFGRGTIPLCGPAGVARIRATSEDATGKLRVRVLPGPPSPSPEVAWPAATRLFNALPLDFAAGTILEVESDKAGSWSIVTSTGEGGCFSFAATSSRGDRVVPVSISLSNDTLGGGGGEVVRSDLSAAARVTSCLEPRSVVRVTLHGTPGERWLLFTPNGDTPGAIPFQHPWSEQLSLAP